MIVRALQQILADDDGVAALAGTNVFPHGFIPIGKKAPAVTLQVVNEARQVRYCNTGNLVNSSVIINSFALRTLDAAKLAKAVRLALTDYKGTVDDTRISRATLDNSLDLKDPEPGTFSVSQSWTVWHSE